MNDIRIKNLRSLNDTQNVPIKNLMLLVGNNSSGKSTFLRVFPLFKQSFTRNINGPILWSGDENDYVDFGSFKEAKNKHTSDDSISFGLEFDTNLHGYLSYHYRNGLVFSTTEIEKTSVKLEIEIKRGEKSDYDYIHLIKMDIKEYRIQIFFNEKQTIKKLLINEKPFSVKNDAHRLDIFTLNGSIFGLSFQSVVKSAYDKLLDLLLDEKHKESPLQLEDGILYLYMSKMLKKDIPNAISKETRDFFEGKYATLKDKELVKELIFLYNLNSYYIAMTDYIRAYFSNVYYIAPIRATAERYYRLRNVAVDEVDCRGKNLPIFLNSLSNKDFHDFQNWTRKYLNFEIEKESSEGHVSLKISRDGKNEAVNLSDAGFGYSQILPIVTQLWYVSKRRNSNKGFYYFNSIVVPRTIIIEQPELHLHPALQAKLMDIMAELAQRGNVRFIIETHSKTMIDRIGKLISNNNLCEDDVEIVLFNKDDDNNTNVSISGYDEEGFLKDWPLGFFEPDEE